MIGTNYTYINQTSDIEVSSSSSGLLSPIHHLPLLYLKIHHTSLFNVDNDEFVFSEE